MLTQFLQWIASVLKPLNGPIVLTPQPVVDVPPQPPETVIYLWDNPTNVRHSVRVLCDEMGMTLEQKNTMCATIGAESVGYNTQAVNRNFVTNAQGIKVLASTDWGLCQWNDYYHGSEIAPQVALQDPEAAVRLMGHYWKLGELYRTWWVAYKNGSYKQYL